MDETFPSQSKNKILAGLSDESYQKLLPHLEAVDLSHGQVIYEMNGPVEYVYFPFNAMISLVTEMSSGAIVEVGLIGNDGMSGITAILGKEISPERAIVQIPNGGVRAKLSVIKKEFRGGGRSSASTSGMGANTHAADVPNRGV